MHHNQSPKKGRSRYAVKNNSPMFRNRVNKTIEDAAGQTNCLKKKKKLVGVSGSSSAHPSSSNILVSGTTPEPTPKNDNQKTSHESTTSTVNSVGKSGVSAGDVTDAPDDPQTPIQTTGSRQLQTTPLSNMSSTGSIPHVDSHGKSTRLQFEEESVVNMDLRFGYGDFVVSIQKRSTIPNSTYENSKEDANQLLPNPGMQFLPSHEMISNIIENLDRLRNHHMLGKSSIPRIDYPDQ